MAVIRGKCARVLPSAAAQPPKEGCIGEATVWLDTLYEDSSPFSNEARSSHVERLLSMQAEANEVANTAVGLYTKLNNLLVRGFGITVASDTGVGMNERCALRDTARTASQSL